MRDIKASEASILIHNALHLQAALRACARSPEDSALLGHLSAWLYDMGKVAVPEGYANEDLLQRAMDARLNAMLENAGIPVQVYQGRNTLCAHCGQPVGDTPVDIVGHDGCAIFYCSPGCRDAHG